MSAQTDRDLHELYLKLGTALETQGQGHESADVYALAGYYARRMGQSALVDHARHLVARCNPAHMGAADQSAPLFYAQLLMQYPANEAGSMLTRLQQSDDAPPTAKGMVPSALEATVADVDLGAVSDKTEPDMPWFITDQEAPDPAKLERHALFELDLPSALDESELEYPDEESESLPAIAVMDEPTNDTPGFGEKALNAVAVMVAVAGVGLIGFFGYALYPAVTNGHLSKAVDRWLAPDRVPAQVAAPLSDNITPPTGTTPSDIASTPATQKDNDQPGTPANTLPNIGMKPGNSPLK